MTAYSGLKYVMLLCSDINIAVIIKLGFSFLQFLPSVIYTITLTIFLHKYWSKPTKQPPFLCGKLKKG